jgi:hypothetical protein
MKLALTDSYQKTYLLCFVVATVVCFSPLKGLAYVVPYACLLMMLIGGGTFDRLFARVLIVAAAVLACFVLYYALYDDFVPARFFLSLITYSAVVPMVFYEPRRLSNPELVGRMLAFAKIVLIIEGTLGIVQALYGATQTGHFDADNGDYVEGTIHLPLDSSRSFSNPMYALNMTLLGIGVFFNGGNARRSPMIFIVVLAAIVLASVVHVLIFLALALLLASFVARMFAHAAPRQEKRKVKVLWRLATLLIVAAFASLIAGNLSKIGDVMELQLSLTFPKAVITADALSDMPQERPSMLLLGLGPGQFCSRAGVIATGEYLQGASLFRTDDPYMFAKYLRPLLDLVLLDERSAGGSSVWPWYSWLTIYAELGVIVTALILSAIIWLVVSTVRILRQSRGSARSVLGVLVGTLLIAFLGIQENYWEIPQAIFPGILLLQAMYARARYHPHERLEVPN